MGARNVSSDGKAQPHTITGLFGRVKRLKQTFWVRNTMPDITHRQRHGIADGQDDIDMRLLHRPHLPGGRDVGGG